MATMFFRDGQLTMAMEESDILLQQHRQKFTVVGNAYVQRDYSSGESRNIEFEVDKFPPQLHNRLEMNVFRTCIGEINLVFKPLGKRTCYNFIESWLTMFTCFLVPTKFQKVIQRLDDLLDQQNREIFIPRGLQILSPYRTGFRNVQIVMFKIPPHPDSQKAQTATTVATSPVPSQQRHRSHRDQGMLDATGTSV